MGTLGDTLTESLLWELAACAAVWEHSHHNKVQREQGTAPCRPQVLVSSCCWGHTAAGSCATSCQGLAMLPLSHRRDSRAGNTLHPIAGSAAATQCCLSGSPSTQPWWGLIISLQVASRNATVSLPAQIAQWHGAGCRM